MNVSLILVPYDSGVRDWRCGLGPAHLVRHGLVDHLRARGHDVTVDSIADDEALPPTEVRTTFELMRRLARRVRTSRENGRFPLVLAGNCNSGPGILSGLTPRSRSVFWFDAHGDLNTPSTTMTGFLDGMALAIAMGRGWEQLSVSIPGFEAVSPELVTLLGARDLDQAELDFIPAAGIHRVLPGALAERMPGLLAQPGLRQTLGYVHCDLDALDPSVGQANSFAVPGGLSADEMIAAVRAIGGAVELGAAAIVSYAPEYDAGGAIARVAFDLAERMLESSSAR